MRSAIAVEEANQEKIYKYIVDSKRNGTIYTGVTSNLANRIYQQKNHIMQGFSAKYNYNILVYIEYFDDMQRAIAKEKIIKGGSRKRKLALIEKNNPNWDDLYHSIL